MNVYKNDIVENNDYTNGFYNMKIRKKSTSTTKSVIVSSSEDRGVRFSSPCQPFKINLHLVNYTSPLSYNSRIEDGKI